MPVIAGIKYEDVEKYLVCLQCKKQLRNPKLLPCLHSLCQNCVEENFRRNKCVCPECKDEVHIDKDPNHTFPSNFFIQNLLDIALIQSSGRKPIPCSNCDNFRSSAKTRCLECGDFLCMNCVNIHKKLRQTKDHRVLNIQEILSEKNENILHRPAYCQSHSAEVLKYFCDTCDEPVCRDCLLIEHREHKYDYIENAQNIVEQKKSLEKLLRETQVCLPALKKALSNVTATCERLKTHARDAKTEIRKTTLNLIKILKERERNLLDEADKIYKEKSTSLFEQERQLQEELNRFTVGCDFTEQVLKYSNEVELLAVKNRISHRLSELAATTRATLTPKETDQLKYDIVTKVAEKAVALALGHVNSDKRQSPDVYSVKTDQEQNEKETKEEECENVFIQSPISVNLIHPNGTLVAPDVIHVGKGQYSISYVPDVNGKYDLQVALKGEEVEGSPVSLTISDIPVPAKQSTQTISGGAYGRLSDPHGLVVNHMDRVLVTDSRNHRVQVFDLDGHVISTFGSKGSQDGQFHYPTGIIISPEGHILVSDTFNNRVQIFDGKGNFLSKLGSDNDTPERLSRPGGLAIDKKGHVIIIERETCQVKTFTTDNKFISGFGSLGEGRGQFNCPSDVTVNSKGDIIVSDFGNDRIQVFGEDGNYKFQFGKAGRKDGQFNWPTGITVNKNNEIIVADSYNHRIQTFTSDGKFISRFGSEGSQEGQFKNPEGVVVTSTGSVIVADWGNDRIQIF